MTTQVPETIAEQVALACDVIEQRLADNLLGIHLYGSALDGGLKPFSDIDLLVTVVERPDAATLRTLQRELLNISAPPGQHPTLRALEVTVIARGDVVPWRHPARRELQFGEWLRQDVLDDVLEPPTTDPDLAILLTKARLHSVALIGPDITALLDAVPRRDFIQALADTLTQWNTPDDWQGDETNIVLALARIWYSAQTGNIAAKDVAVDWLLPRIPAAHHPVVAKARQIYLGADETTALDAALAEFIHFAKAKITALLQAQD